MRKIITITLLLFCSSLSAQKLSVDSFKEASNDLSARTQARQDNNGDDCALVKVQVAAQGVTFPSGVIGNVAFKNNEYWVYMPSGSKRLKVVHPSYLPLEVNFADHGVPSVKGKSTYVLTLVLGDLPQGMTQPKIQTGWIIIDSEPTGASVYVNDEFVGNTPLNNYKQAYGTYTYRLEHPNYHASTGTIELSSSRIEKKVALLPAFGAISVTSNVTGAKVTLDGRDTGQRTPCTLQEVASGPHTVTIQMEQYAPLQQSVLVEDGKTAQLKADLSARFAKITIQSLEGAQIYCNGTQIATTQYSDNMMEGFYDLEVRLAHHESVTRQVQVVAGQAQDLTLNPIPIYGSLDVVSTPHDATVQIDGKEYGKTPLTVEQLLEGEHKVNVSADGYATDTKTVVIKANESVALNVVLDNTSNLKEKISEYIEHKQYDEALKLLREHAEQGEAWAQSNLGNMYYKGEGVPQDKSEAVRWYRKAAEQGHADAQCNLGVMYNSGQGVTEDKSEAVRWYRKAAEQGLARAQFNLGIMYYNGEGVAQDKSEAVRWFRKAAEQGHANAQFNLGVMYSNGEGVAQDKSEAVRWFRKAAEQGHADAQFNLGNMYNSGQGVTEDKSEAVRWYRKAAEQGHASAQCNLGNRYYNGEGVTQNKSETVRWYRKAAEQGHARAQCDLGNMYYNGEGVAQDKSEAVRWYRKAAEQGHADAQCNLGIMYYNGEGVAQDKSEAVRWYRKAAEQGLANAQCNLGLMYENGEGVAQDKSEAVRWYRKAAEQGLANAQCNLGWMYENGQGVTEDKSEAVRWYRKAAEQGYARGQFNLGWMYYNGEGVTQNKSEAIRWFRKAAEQGHANAQYNLGVGYDNGEGVAQDRSEAVRWYRKAAEQGYEKAKQQLQKMQNR